MNDELPILFLCVIMFVGMVISINIGSDLLVTVYSVLLSIPGACVFYLLTRFKSLNFNPVGAGAALIWPVWWSVLDNVASKCQKINFIADVDYLWWDSSLFKYGVEMALVLLAIRFISRGGSFISSR